MTRLKDLLRLTIVPAVLIFFPFAFLFPYAFSIHHHYVRIGNDFGMPYYDYKVYLLDSLSHGHLPLWSPSESAGYPLFSSPFSQFFYPFNALLTVFYHLAGGYSRLDHQRFTILGISIFSLGLYYWLEAIGVNRRAAIFSALTMSISFKMTEILRFPNAMHAAAWYPWILLGMTF